MGDSLVTFLRAIPKAPLRHLGPPGQTPQAMVNYAQACVLSHVIHDMAYGQYANKLPARLRFLSVCHESEDLLKNSHLGIIREN